MEEWIRNIPHAKTVRLTEEIDYEPGKVASKTLAQRPGVGMTLFAFDIGEGIRTHAAGGDAMAQVLEGEAEITVGGVVHWVTAGHAIVMPAGVPHSLHALTPFKMLLTVVMEA